MELKEYRKTILELKEENIFNNKYFMLNKKLLKSVGLWPYQDVRLKRVMGILLFMCIYSMVIPQVLRAFEELYAEIVNLEIIIECITGMLLCVAITARLVMMTLQESKMRYIYEEMTRDCEEIIDSGEKAVLQRFCNIGRILSILYCVYCQVTALIFVCAPAIAPMIFNTLLNTTYKKSICLYAEYFVDQDEYFVYIFSHILFVSVVGTLFYSTFDATFILIVQHAVALLKVLKYRLNKLSKIFDRLKYSRKDNAIIHHKIKSCIMIHNKILQFIEVIDSTYNAYHLFLYSVLLLALSIFTIDLVVLFDKKDYFTLLRLGCCWIAIIVYMFYFNWPGQKIIDGCEEIFVTIYLSNWYSFPLKTRKLIKFMLLRGGYHTFLTAGIFEMSFETVGSIMKTAMSYMTVFISFL